MEKKSSEKTPPKPIHTAPLKPGKYPGKDAPLIPLGKHDECGNCSSMILNQFASSFDKSAKRWELIVYPSLFSFIILAMYGFFLIYSLTQDIRTMAVSIDPKMGVNMGGMSTNIKSLSDNIASMSTHLEYISDNMEVMSVNVQGISEGFVTMNKNVYEINQQVAQMSHDMGAMNLVMHNISDQLDSLAPLTSNVASMTQAMHVMTNSVSRMGYDLGGAARPMSFINRFMPWGGG
ncbi:hypothetical protein ACQZV8_12515 [Magnetococcales bacterium HHB-1]